MAKHRFPVRVRAISEGIKSGRRLAITGAVVVAMGAAGAGMAMASPGGSGGGGGGGNGSATITASTSGRISEPPRTVIVPCPLMTVVTPSSS